LDSSANLALVLTHATLLSTPKLLNVVNDGIILHFYKIVTSDETTATSHSNLRITKMWNRCKPNPWWQPSDTLKHIAKSCLDHHGMSTAWTWR